MNAATPFWNSHKHTDRKSLLRRRNHALRQLRAWFEAQDFCEVDTAILQISPGNEAHIGAFATHWRDLAGKTQPLYLHTSPEFACKKLIAAGEARIFSTQHVFRNGERSALHHPEFTMLEWYRAGAGVTQMMDDCLKIMQVAARACAGEHLRYKSQTCDPNAAPETLSVMDAFQKFAGIALGPLLPTPTNPAPILRDAFAKAATNAGLRIAADDHWSDIFSKVLAACIEPNLGLNRPTFLTDYPAVEAALARVNPSDPRFAERFELYACGVELANGFGELTNSAMQRNRFEMEMNERQRIYGERYPLDEDFLKALDFMPPTSGCALGFDRLVMLLLEVPRIEDVIWTPLPEIIA